MSWSISCFGALGHAQLFCFSIHQKTFSCRTKFKCWICLRFTKRSSQLKLLCKDTLARSQSKYERSSQTLVTKVERPVFPALGSIHSTVLTSSSSNTEDSCTRKLDRNCGSNPFSFETARSFLNSSLSTAKRDRHKPQDHIKLPTSSTTGSPSAFFSARSLFHWSASIVAGHCVHHFHTFRLTFSTTR